MILYIITVVEVDEALYFWIDTTLLRMVISENLDKTTANRLKAIRPIPNNFAIIATTPNMEKLFETVNSQIFSDIKLNKYFRQFKKI